MKPYLALTDNSLASIKAFAESKDDPIVIGESHARETKRSV